MVSANSGNVKLLERASRQQILEAPPGSRLYWIFLLLYFWIRSRPRSNRLQEMYEGMANQEGNVDEKETRLELDLSVCKASKEELLSLAGKLKIPDENLEVPEFKLKVVMLDHIGDVLEKKNRWRR